VIFIFVEVSFLAIYPFVIFGTMLVMSALNAVGRPSASEPVNRFLRKFLWMDGCNPQRRTFSFLKSCNNMSAPPVCLQQHDKRHVLHGPQVTRDNRTRQDKHFFRMIFARNLNENRATVWNISLFFGVIGIRRGPTEATWLLVCRQ